MAKTRIALELGMGTSLRRHDYTKGGVPCRGGRVVAQFLESCRSLALKRQIC